MWETDWVKQQLVAGSKGYDIPAFATLRNFNTWANDPPKGGVWNYPPRGEVIQSECEVPRRRHGSPTRSCEATTSKMIAQHTQQGKTAEQAIDWAAGELEGFMRT